jgi:hypothetical protein
MFRVFGDERIIAEMRVGASYAIKLIDLSGAKPLLGIEAPDAFEQPLGAKDFMDARYAAAKPIRRIEEGSISVRDLHVASHPVGRNGLASVGNAAALTMKCHGELRPYGPVAEQSAHDPPLCISAIAFLKPEGSEQVADDVVIIPGVERDVVPPCLDHGTDDIDRLIAIEWRYFDRYDILDFGKPAPESVRQ